MHALFLMNEKILFKDVANAGIEEISQMEF